MSILFTFTHNNSELQDDGYLYINDALEAYSFKGLEEYVLKNVLFDIYNEIDTPEGTFYKVNAKTVYKNLTSFPIDKEETTPIIVCFKGSTFLTGGSENGIQTTSTDHKFLTRGNVAIPGSSCKVICNAFTCNLLLEEIETLLAWSIQFKDTFPD